MSSSYLEMACISSITDTGAADGRRGSNVFEVNPWLWQFGRGKPRLGGLSYEETDDRREATLISEIDSTNYC